MVPHNQGSLLWHFRLTDETYLISGQLNSISSFRGDKYYDEMAPVKKVTKPENMQQGPRPEICTIEPLMSGCVSGPGLMKICSKALGLKSPQACFPPKTRTYM